MSCTFYSKYVNHCLRNYVRHPRRNRSGFRSTAEELDWNACDGAIRYLPDKEKEIVIAVYKKTGTMQANVMEVSKEFGVCQSIKTRPVLYSAIRLFGVLQD